MSLLTDTSPSLSREPALGDDRPVARSEQQPVEQSEGQLVERSEVRAREAVQAAPLRAPVSDNIPFEPSYFSLLQTVTATFLTGPELVCLKIEATCSKKRTRLFEYGFSRGRKGFPLVFLIPGFGCAYNHGTVLYMTEKLVARGFHVAVLHSPSHPDFLMSSHHSGAGGVFSEDARDAMMGMQAISEQLRHMGVEYGVRHLIGYSMGALNAAFARFIEKQSTRIFDRVVLINPPVDLAHGMRQLDNFVRALEMPKFAKYKLIAKAGLAIVAPKKLGLDRTRLIKGFLRRPIWSQMELRALIGHSFEGTVTGGLKVAALLGTLREGQVVQTFSDYCEFATVPHYRRENPEATITDLYRTESLVRVAEDLAKDKDVFIMHNEDDFLLRPQDVPWLKSAFGDNIHCFKTGGHLGNVWRPEFQAVLESSLGV